eukprot:14526226-Alexandrium_andersonii.AAC.2
MLGLHGLELHVADACHHGADHVHTGAAQVLDPGQHGHHDAEHGAEHVLDGAAQALDLGQPGLHGAEHVLA